ALAQAQAKLAAVFAQIERILADLEPYTRIRTEIAAARSRFRELTAKFVEELKNRCTALTADQKQTLVLELVVQDLQAGLDAHPDARQRVSRRCAGNQGEGHSRWQGRYVGLASDRP